MEKLLQYLYSDIKNPTSFTGQQQLYRAAKRKNKKVTWALVRQFLQGQKAYTLHKITRRKFPRLKTVAPKPNVIVSMDLGDMSKLAKYNSGYKYILVAVDVFSRVAQVIPQKTKTGSETLSSVKILLKGPYFDKISRLFCDEGREFYNRKLKDYLQQHNITLYSTFNREIKVSIAEIF